jgi:hypothetical protein
VNSTEQKDDVTTIRNSPGEDQSANSEFASENQQNRAKFIHHQYARQPPRIKQALAHTKMLETLRIVE